MEGAALELSRNSKAASRSLTPCVSASAFILSMSVLNSSAEGGQHGEIKSEEATPKN